MKLTIRARHLEISPELDDQLRRRLEFALGHLAAAIRAVHVTIVDTNGPKGGHDKQCRIRVRGAWSTEIMIQQTGADVTTTVALAAERAGQAIARSLARRRDVAIARAS